LRTLITGGKGLLATPLVARLEPRHEVFALDIDELDVTDAGALARAFDEQRFEAALHLAAWTDVDGCERDPERAELVNGQGTRNVAEQCARLGIPMLYVSTDYVFDGTKQEPYVETDPVNPISAYGRSKLSGEAAVQELVADWRIVRCQSIYGIGRKSFVDAILARARSGGALSVVTDQRVSPSYAEDLADAVACVFERCPPGIYHACNAGSCTWYECAQAALEIDGRGDTKIGPITADALGRAAPRPAYSPFSCAKLAELGGLSMRTWRDALEAYLAVRREEEGK
jgi:dTDP-4-dehydrorhamnose reductase